MKLAFELSANLKINIILYAILEQELLKKAS